MLLGAHDDRIGTGEGRGVSDRGWGHRPRRRTAGTWHDRGRHGEKLDLAVEELHRSESHLVTVLTSMSVKDTADHEVFYATHDMAKWSRQHVADLVSVLVVVAAPSVGEAPRFR
ncbi:hypothetical protein DQ240_22690 [Blastococcus sp. TF02A-26]|nr:hypothetical protein DQ240_22690 [Blastococcus sp. TF02A-26]